MVHNLPLMSWDPAGGRSFDWAASAQERLSDLIRKGDTAPSARNDALGREVRLAKPTPEHYLPLLTVLGLRKGDEPIEFFNDRTVMGSVSMTSIQLGSA